MRARFRHGKFEIDERFGMLDGQGLVLTDSFHHVSIDPVGEHTNLAHSKGMSMAKKPSFNGATGIIIGVVIGLLLDNIGAGIGIGIAIAIAMSIR
jgi:hypothetical protein